MALQLFPMPYKPQPLKMRLNIFGVSRGARRYRVLESHEGELTKTVPISLERTCTPAISWLAAIALCVGSLSAQVPESRITAQIDNSEHVVIPHTQSPRARVGNDTGRVEPGTKLEGVSIVFSRSAAQEADLQTLLAAQQSPSSKLYHKWLTPEEFGARFGVADADIAAVESWLERQGFSVNGVSRSKNRITFSGTVEQVEAAFGTELHYYQANGETRFAPSGDISVPAALSSVVKTVGNLSSFRPKSHLRLRLPQRDWQSRFTSGQTNRHYLTPGDVATIYDITSAYSAGYTGADQSIAVVGQSAIVVSDIEKFQSAAGLAIKDPTLVLVPNSGSSVISSGDEAESDLDLEYSGAIAPGATIYFVYTGSNQSYSAWDSIPYAVDNQIAPIISVSYGLCETALSSSDYSTMNSVLAQAAAQGQSVIAASGDSGSTDCYGQSGMTAAQQMALAVDYPASSQYVTGMGGTEFSSDDVSASNTTYWKSGSGSDVVSSALSYIPEQVWNDDSSSSGLSSGGGGVSTFTARPSWQSGVTGIPSGSYRLVPDISLDSSSANAAYIFCSSDYSSTSVSGSCSNGFRDSSNEYLTVAGGTSFASPIFAGMLAIINQKLNSTGQGVVNSSLYTLAADSSTYASVFHDITSGSNACTAGSSYCTSAGAASYSATAGYDEATGLGSLQFYNLLMAWPTSSSTLVTSATALSAETTSPLAGASDAITITVSSGASSSTVIPTGTLTIVVDGTTVASSLALTSGSAAYVFSSTTGGSHVVTAVYSGDDTYASSDGTLLLTVTGTKSFTLSATDVSVSAGSTSRSTITITPKNGYTGTIAWTVTSSPSLSNGCFSLASTAVSSSSAVTAALTIYTNSSACSSSSVMAPVGRNRRSPGADPSLLRGKPRFLSLLNIGRVGTLLLGLLLVGLLGFGPRGLRASVSLLLLAAACLAVVACGGGGSGASSSSLTTTSYAAKGTYTVMIVGTDTSSSSLTASTTITLTVD